MKLEKKHWIIIGVVVAIILVWYFFLRKKNGGNVAKLNNQGRAFIPGGEPGQAELERMKDEKTKLKTGESNFRGGGRGFGGGGFRGGFHGGGGHHPHPGHRPWGGWGYPGPFFGYYDIYDPIVVRSTDCPEGWIWMGAMLGCQKPPM